MASAMNYDFLAPGRIVFGWGRRAEIGQWSARLGTRAFLVMGSRSLERAGTVDELISRLESAGVAVVRLAQSTREPRVADVDSAVARVRAIGVSKGDFLWALGGGGAIDLAKAVAGLAPQPHDASCKDYLEGVGKGLTLVADPLPLLAMPTTAGAGSEATKNAVISNDDPPFKKSLRSDAMIPRVALVDPELTVTLPASLTAWTGMDALTQLIESYLSRRARPIAQALALHGIELAAPALPIAVADPSNREARERMAHAALLSGMALANSGLGLAHGVAAALGVHANVAHGLACAVMLPMTLRANRASRTREMARLAPFFGVSAPNESAAADGFVDAVDRLADDLKIPRRLSELGVDSSLIPALVRDSHGNSRAGNPRDVPDEELLERLEAMA